MQTVQAIEKALQVEAQLTVSCGACQSLSHIMEVGSVTRANIHAVYPEVNISCGLCSIPPWSHCWLMSQDHPFQSRGPTLHW